MVTLWTRGLRPVHVLPRGRPAEHVVDLLELGKRLVGHFLWRKEENVDKIIDIGLPCLTCLLDVLDVGAGRAGETVAGGPLFDAEDVGAARAEHQHLGEDGEEVVADEIGFVLLFL